METFVISLGGSVINPSKINVKFLKEFVKLIIKHKDKRFAIVCGGGGPARDYMAAAKKITGFETKEDMDKIGIAATKLNAELIKSLLAPIAYEEVISNPTMPPETDKRVLVSGGWKPGCSTDLDAIYFAEAFSCYRLINISNVDYVYDNDPRKYKNAKKFKKLTWDEYLKLFGTEWKPGLHSPFDPIASKRAAGRKTKVAIIGPRLKELDKLLKDEKDFNGTLIHG